MTVQNVDCVFAGVHHELFTDTTVTIPLAHVAGTTVSGELTTNVCVHCAIVVVATEVDEVIRAVVVVVTGAVVVVGTLLVALGSQGPASNAGLDQEKSQKFPVVPEYMVN